MGFFGKKKTTIVSSTVYNMAGEEENRPNFLKNSIYAAIMSPHDPFLGETIVRNLLKGPGINQRNFFRWAQRNEYPGLPTYSVTQQNTIDAAVIAPFIPLPGSPADLVLEVQAAYMVSGSYDFVVQKYVLENFPENYNTDYVSSLDPSSNNITIQWVGGGTEIFSAGTYDQTKTYIVANYYHYVPAQVQDLVTGSTTVGDLAEPNLNGYNLDSSVNTGIVNYPMSFDTRVVTTYTGVPTLPADTDETTADSDNPGFNGTTKEYSKTIYQGGDGEGEEVTNREYFLYLDEYRQIYTNNTIVSTVVNENTPAAGQTQTVVTHRIGDHLRPIYDYRVDTQDTFLRMIPDGSFMWVYETGTGNSTLDDLVELVDVTALDSEYFPYMPIRLDNVSITHPMYDDITGSGLYEKTNRAYRRASSGMQRFSKLIDEVEDNPDIDDIDYAFTHHGVNLNVTEPACKRYMYTWFKNISDLQNTNSTYMAEYAALVVAYVNAQDALDAWVYDQGETWRPMYGDPRPDTPDLDDIRTNTIGLRCADGQLQNLDQRITWVNITETLHTGVGKTGAVTDDIWWQGYPGTPTPDDDLSWVRALGITGVDGRYEGGVELQEYEVEQLKLIWQIDANNYKKLTIWGLVHNNLVYNGESVEISGREALGSNDPTGFIVPLHYPTVKELGIVDATQMATANTYIIFNSYEIVKQKWYQTFIGMVIIFIAIVAITVITGGLGAGAGAGILGTNAAVGAAVGLTGTAAILAGAIINALVAIAISQIVSYASTAIFGDKWGAVIAAVINLAITMGTSGGGFSNLSELGTASNILAITSAVANGYEGYTAGAVAEIGQEMEENKEKFEAEAKKIEKMLSDLRGGNDLQFNPLSLTDSVRGNALSSSGGYTTETVDEFIHRTMMTGSDIVDITLSMVNNYADLSLELPS